MKKRDLSKLALLGMTSGIMAMGSLSASEASSLDVQNLLAKPACKAGKGCASITADREAPTTQKDSTDEDSTDEDEDSDDADEKKEEQKTKPSNIQKGNQKSMNTPSVMPRNQSKKYNS